MSNTWQELTNLTQSEEIVIERVRLTKKDIAIDGNFELPLIAKLTMEDHIFIAAFIKTHGSIKQMEHMFGVSYPTIKNRLNRIGEYFDFVKVETLPEDGNYTKENKNDILKQLNMGNISVNEALERLKK